MPINGPSSGKLSLQPRHSQLFRLRFASSDLSYCVSNSIHEKTGGVRRLAQILRVLIHMFKVQPLGFIRQQRGYISGEAKPCSRTLYLWLPESSSALIFKFFSQGHMNTGTVHSQPSGSQKWSLRVPVGACLSACLSVW